MNVFAGLKKTGMNTASFRENDHTLFDILRFVTHFAYHLKNQFVSQLNTPAY